jgi:Zn-dependent peptidase ImmA (M78 family)/plasmid maintenance system antidote protein VapI
MFSANRLELARKRRRYTAKNLCERAKIAPVTLSRIVNGKQTPDEDTVNRLAKALAYPADFFSQAEIDEIDASSASFRSMKAMTARERDAAIAAGSLAYVMSDWVKNQFNLPDADILDLNYESDPAGAARTLRQYWAIGEKPISHMIKLLETKGVRVFSLSENTKTVDAFSCWRNNEPYIFLNTFKTAERSRFDAAHELGHLVLHKHGGPKQGNAEAEANAFASSFLMPRADVVSKIPYVVSLDDILKAKVRWGVSVLALTYRLHTLNIITDWQYRSFCIQINRKYRNTEPNGLPLERSSVWHMVLSDLWKRGISRNRVASDLFMPHDEMESLLFGLTGETVPPKKALGKPVFKAIK